MKKALKKEILISKELQRELKDIMRDARKDSCDLEMNEGIDSYFDSMRYLGFTKKCAEELFDYANNRAYIEGDAKARPSIKPGWLPVKEKK